MTWLQRRDQPLSPDEFNQHIERHNLPLLADGDRTWRGQLDVGGAVVATTTYSPRDGQFCTQADLGFDLDALKQPAEIKLQALTGALEVIGRQVSGAAAFVQDGRLAIKSDATDVTKPEQVLRSINDLRDAAPEVYHRLLNGLS